MEYGLIGEKLEHSFSKTVHNLIGGYNYELKEISKEELESFIKEKDFKGINVTIPYKEKVIPYLDFIDDAAKKIGVVNTVVNKNGKLLGYNTDFYGLKALIEKTKIEIKAKKVLILGSGGTSKTAFAVAKDMGAKEILIVSRNSGDGLITYEEACKNHSDAEIIINTTPVGMYSKIGIKPIELKFFNNLCGVVDVIYNPLKSALVTEAKQRNIKATGGLYMLISQAVFAAEKFSDKELPETETDRIYRQILNDKRNIVLIGMPSSGKSTVGIELAKKIGKEFFDSDTEIEKITNMKIPDIFKTFGEKHFREIEAMVIANLSLKQSSVIATGGGVILNKRNMELLKENGFVVFLDRSIENLTPTDDRPLSSSMEMLHKRYNERYENYCLSANLKINANGTVEQNANKIKEGFLNENSCN